jgi:KDO2-lipid IV(A) lauroyltransferase
MTSYATYLMLQVFTFALNALPLVWALWIGRCLGRMAFTVVRSRRTVALRNLQTAFGQEKSYRELESLAKRTFSNLGMTLVEFLRMPRLGMSYYQRYVRVEGWEHLSKALEGGAGVIALTFHFGNWELPSLGANFFGYPIVALAQKIHNPWIDGYVRRTRKATGIKILPKRRVTQQVIHHLRQGKIVALFVDQRERSQSQVGVDFFGKKAPSTPSPVIFSLRTGAPMMPLFTVREKHIRHRVIIGPSLAPKTTGDTERDLLINTEAYTKILETMIRRYPDQYFWLHNRWGAKKRRSRRPGGL